MLKKCLKGIGIVGAVYAIANGLYLAWVGCGTILGTCRDTEDATVTGVSGEVCDKTIENWKWWLSLFKG